MAAYEASDIKSELHDYAGELMVVLESGEEYELHIHDTEFPDENLIDAEGFIETEGMVDGEYRVVRFPASAVEHTYIHKES